MSLHFRFLLNNMEQCFGHTNDSASQQKGKVQQQQVEANYQIP